MTQLKMTDWDVVNAQKSRSSVRRINWKAIFGRTIPDIVHEYREKGFDSETTLRLLQDKLFNMCIDNPVLHNNLKISVCSRFAEQNMMKKRGVI